MTDDPPRRRATDVVRRRSMQIQSIRFSDEQWVLIQEVAGQTGVAAGQFVRESAVAHAMALAVLAGGGESTRIWLQTLEALADTQFDIARLEAAYRLHAEHLERSRA